MQLLPKLFQTIPMLCLLLTGCASISEVKNKDRDLSNSYDGIWIAKYQTTKRYQKYSNWTFTCPQVTTPLWMEINNSGIRTSVNYEYIAPLNEAYISSTGTFKTTLPSNYKAKTSKFSDTQESDIETRIIIEGTLNPVGQGTGRLTFGYATSKFKGCNTDLNFTRDQKLTENPGEIVSIPDEVAVTSSQISKNPVSGTYVSDITSNSLLYFKSRSLREMEITFQQDGNEITGINETYQLEITGTRKGEDVTFSAQSPFTGLFVGSGVSGQWKINADGSKLVGNWNRSGRSGQWHLEKVK